MLLCILRIPIYSEQEYANLAINLGNDQEQYTKIRKQLIDHNLNHKESPYWNLEQYVKHLEVGFQAIWERYISGEAPAHVNITHIIKNNKDGNRISGDNHTSNKVKRRKILSSSRSNKRNDETINSNSDQNVTSPKRRRKILDREKMKQSSQIKGEDNVYTDSYSSSSASSQKGAFPLKKRVTKKKAKIPFRKRVRKADNPVNSEGDTDSTHPQENKVKKKNKRVLKDRKLDSKLSKRDERVKFGRNRLVNVEDPIKYRNGIIKKLFSNKTKKTKSKKVIDESNDMKNEPVKGRNVGDSPPNKMNKKTKNPKRKMKIKKKARKTSGKKESINKEQISENQKNHNDINSPFKSDFKTTVDEL